MKFSTIAGVVLALGLASTDAAGQRDDQFVWGVSGGAAIVSGLVSDHHETGPQGALMFGIGGVGSPLGIRLDATYGALGDKSGSFALRDQGEARIFSIMGNAIVNLYGSNRHIYAVGGLGGYWYNPDGPASAAENDLIIGGGLGVFFPRLGFIEARWTNLYRALPDPDTGVTGKKSARLYPITLGIMF
jgi:hypothetical protein